MNIYMRSRPTNAWVLPESGSGKARMIPEEELADAFDFYEDTGYEPKIGWLYRVMDCETVGMRDLPGLGHLWFDDDGMLKKRWPSPIATALHDRCYSQVTPVVGTCVLVVYPDAAAKGVDDVVLKAQEGVDRLRGVGSG